RGQEAAVLVAPRRVGDQDGVEEGRGEHGGADHRDQQAPVLGLGERWPRGRDRRKTAAGPPGGGCGTGGRRPRGQSKEAGASIARPGASNSSAPAAASPGARSTSSPVAARTKAASAARRRATPESGHDR